MHYVRRASRRQLLSVRQARLADTVGLYARIRRWCRGRSDGQRLHAAAGGPESAPIFFSIDEDIDAETWKSVPSSMASRYQLSSAWNEPASTATPGYVGGRSPTASSGIRRRRDIGGPGRPERGRMANENPPQCSTNGSSSPRRTPASAWAGPTSTRTTSWQPTTVSGISLADSQ